MPPDDPVRTLRIRSLRDANLALYVGQLVLAGLTGKGTDTPLATAWADQVVLLMLAGRTVEGEAWEAVVAEYGQLREVAKMEPPPEAGYAYVLESEAIMPTLSEGGPGRRPVETRCPMCSCYPSSPEVGTGCDCVCHG